MFPVIFCKQAFAYPDTSKKSPINSCEQLDANLKLDRLMYSLSFSGKYVKKGSLVLYRRSRMRSDQTKAANMLQ